ncbi:MAG: DUF1501 domain-containing protein [Planctomycetes bacterium]|nr:DUF1501 domain-containing protein [Planctomycetota bacterium]
MNWKCCTRRELLAHGTTAGLAGVALQYLLGREATVTGAESSASASQSISPLTAKPPHFPARADSVLFLMMEGGPSQVDTFDPKSALERVHGELFQRENVKTNQVKGNRYFVRSPFSFRSYGQCGMQVSELFSETAQHVDDIAFIRSAYGESDNHPAAVFQYTTGYPIQGHPSMGAWIVYGLGCENENLPAFVVLRDGKPFGGTTSWGNGFLPATFQGVQFRGGDKPVLDLAPPASISRGRQQDTLRLVQALNGEHLRGRTEFADLASRIASYELAFRMQSEIPRAIDLAAETAATHKLYGLDADTTRAFGSRCLLARRLIEQGVRFVQVWSGGWDSHDDVATGHRNAAAQVDRPIAGLLTDLKQRGLLERTLVVWGGEFGRTVDTTEAAHKKQKPGRDHNPRAMTIWFAGGGVRSGTVLGATDEFGERAAENAHHLKDVHATLLHLLGLDHERLSAYHGGRFQRLTDIGAAVIPELIA